ncbi:hypothetical protein TNCV_4249411 [Trichonephila clavipes]|nr:hypothetical protein TNCV_4249411 [Trichonephila clavipes]
MPTKGIPALIKRFEENDKLGIQPGKGRKRVIPVLVDAVKAKENPRIYTETPRRSPKFTVWWEFTATYSTLGNSSLRKPVNMDLSHVPLRIRRCNDMLQTLVVPQPQQRRVLTSTIFTQDVMPLPPVPMGP